MIGIDLQTFLIIFGASSALFFIFLFSKNKLLSWLKTKAIKTKNHFDDQIVESVSHVSSVYIMVVIFYTVSLFYGSNFSNNITEFYDNFYFRTLTGVFAAYTFFIVSNFIGPIITLLLKARQKLESKDKVDQTLKSLITLIIKMLMLIILFFLILSLFGVQANTLFAGAGISAIVIGFALQSVMQDLFSALAIYLDQPFKVGDFIVVGTESGTVQKIGLKSTRVKTLYGNQLIFDNSDLSNSRINNYTGIKSRRVDQSIYINSESSIEDIKLMKEELVKLFKEVKVADFARFNLATLTPGGYQYEFTYTIKTGDFDVFSNTRDLINTELVKIMNKYSIKQITNPALLLNSVDN